MHEPVAPPKKQVPYAWLVGGVAILSVCAMVMSVSNGTTANKNLDALIAAQSIAAKNAEASSAAQAAAATRERALQGQIEALSATLKEAEVRQVSYTKKATENQAADRANVQRLAAAEKRIAELTAELTRLRKEEATPPKVTETILKGDAASRKPVLLAEALKAWDEGNLYVAKAKFEAILAIDPKDLGAAEGLGMVIYAINDASVARKASERAAGGR